MRAPEASHEPTTKLPDLGAQPWFNDDGVRHVFALLDRDGEEARVIGGAVRNALFGLPVGDIDFATTATPDVIVRRAAAAGIKAVPTGIDHGTVTLVIDGHGYEVTALREDIATDGRHAVVRFGRDWDADARRRDFTINALSATADGRIHDPVGGYDDVVARRVRFIGDAVTRIAEDRLRILRFFRFHAEYAEGAPDPAGLSAAMAARNELRDLSAERVGQEMRKIVVARHAVEVATEMQEHGIMGVVLGGIAYLAPFAKAIRAQSAAKATLSVAARLATLACRIEEDVLRVVERLRLSNVERDRMLAALSAAERFTPFPDERAARALLYRFGEEAYRDGVFQGFAWSASPPGDAWKNLYHLPDRWTPPRFPLTGRDVMASGRERGPEVGALLRAVESWWVAEDFAPDESAVRARLQQMIAAQQ
jgi:tRNA nucleotidyltransferase/poly(A) polymerase